VITSQVSRDSFEHVDVATDHSSSKARAIDL
jgi:hypothetical protein